MRYFAHLTVLQAQAHGDLSDLGSVTSEVYKSCAQLSASRLLSFLVSFLAASQDNQAILRRLIHVDDYVQKVETLRHDFAALEAKLPQLDEVIDRLQTISADTQKEVGALPASASHSL